MSTDALTLGISISEPDPDELGRLGLGLMHAQDVMVETARYLLGKGCNLVYGGDLGYDGVFNFSDLLFQLAMTYGRREQTIVNYTAFPLYTRIAPRRRAELINIAAIIPVNPSPAFDRWCAVWYEEAPAADRQYLDELFEGRSDHSRQVWAASLTAMRRQVTQAVACHIVMGGKVASYKGVMPGIFEETLLCVAHHVPVLINGELGGAARCIVDLVMDRDTAGRRQAEPFFKDVDPRVFKPVGTDRLLFEGTRPPARLHTLLAGLAR